MHPSDRALARCRVLPARAPVELDAAAQSRRPGLSPSPSTALSASRRRVAPSALLAHPRTIFGGPPARRRRKRAAPAIAPRPEPLPYRPHPADVAV